ncbi:MAG: efflux RND transporter permease subunit [Terrimicrobiaceae bacterium]
MRAPQKTNRFSRASERRIALPIKRGQTHILLACALGALAALGACAPLAEASKTECQAEEVPGLLIKLRKELDGSVPGVRCVVKQLEQGPPVEEPIQIGENLDQLRQLADQAKAAVRAAGAYHAFDDLGLRMPNIQIDIDQDRANSLGLNNQQIGNVAQASFTELKVTELREGDLIPVLIRGRAEDRTEAEKIRALYVQTSDRKSVPFDSFANIALQPASHGDSQSLRAFRRAGFRDTGSGAPCAGQDQVGAGLRNEIRR